jgi:hypothetical protein
VKEEKNEVTWPPGCPLWWSPEKPTSSCTKFSWSPMSVLRHLSATSAPTMPPSTTACSVCLEPYTGTHQNYNRRKKLENRGHPIGRKGRGNPYLTWREQQRGRADGNLHRVRPRPARRRGSCHYISEGLMVRRMPDHEGWLHGYAAAEDDPDISSGPIGELGLAACVNQSLVSQIWSRR